MSPATLASGAARLRQALVHAAWAQWAALGLPAGNVRPARSIVDPEALVLASLWLRRHEPRLEKLLRIWAGSGGVRLLSTQRIKNLVTAFPDDVATALGAFAVDAVTVGKDSRWRGFAGTATRKKPKGWKDGETSTAVPDAPGALMLRLRLGLGVGIKADVLAFLIGGLGARHTVRDVTLALGYQGRAVRRALEELAAARFIESVPTGAVSYRANERKWMSFFDLVGREPGWWYWQQLYAFGADLDETARTGAALSPYVQGSRARDVMERHRQLTVLLHLPAVELERYAGQEYLGAFQETLDWIAERVVRNWV